MKYQYISMAIIVGFALPIQGIINSKLGFLMSHPMHSTLISYIGGVVACLLFLAIFHPVFPEIRSFQNIDWYLYLGGFLGAVFVSGMLYIIPKIGATNMLAAAIVGQLIMSMILDHFGILGVQQIRISTPRVLGVVCLFVGLFLIKGQFTFSELSKDLVK